MTGAELREVILEELHDSPWNPRTRYHKVEIDELAKSMQANGQLTPIVVRPRAKGGYEIGAGHCRLRAAKLAGLTVLEARIRELDDVAFLELLNIENLARNDLHPLEEAGGFRTLMERAGYSIERLAERVGKSKDYVYDRLKLLQLVPEARKYFEEDVITVGHAVLLARLTPANQKRAIGNPDRINRYGYHDGTGLFQADHADHDPAQPGLALKNPIKARSVRELATWINDHIRFRPEDNDLPALFPATATALAESAQDDLAPVYITYDHQLKHDAKDPKARTYGLSSWRRADGKQRSRPCTWSRIGIVAGGPHRGDAFRVCVNRDKCDVHFKAARTAAKRRRAGAASSGTDNTESLRQRPGEDSWEKQERLRQERQKAFEKRLELAAPRLLGALSATLQSTPVTATSKAGRFFLEDMDTPTVTKDIAKQAPRGTDADALVRRAIYAGIAYQVRDAYDLGKGMFEDFAALGIDAQKILDEAAPVAATKPAKTLPARKGGRK